MSDNRQQAIQPVSHLLCLCVYQCNLVTGAVLVQQRKVIIIYFMERQSSLLIHHATAYKCFGVHPAHRAVFIIYQRMLIQCFHG
ncbi:hypothetical protein D3C86_1395280 [compost metagenome]